MTAWVGMLSSSSLSLQKKEGRVKTVTKIPCVAKQLPVYLVNVNLFFSKQGRNE